MDDGRMAGQKPLSALFVGLGSIGTRHLANLRALCAGRGQPLAVTALRSSQRPLGEKAAPLVDREVFSWPAAGERYDLAFVTGPTHLHAEALGRLRGVAGALFIEKPLANTAAIDLAALGLDDAGGQRAYVAAPMRHTTLYAALKKALGQFSPYSARIICSSYLPEWRSGVDYRTVYSAHKAMGGGVSLDLIHEWDYLAGLFGLPAAVHCLRGQLSHLEVDADDLAVYIARYPAFLAEVHLDYFGRGYRRTAEFLGEAGTLAADFGAGTLTLPNGTVQNHAEEANRRYQREMAWFLDYAEKGGENLNSPAHALDVLRVALAGE